MYKVILLDVDDTILNFQKAELYAIKKVLREENIKPTKKTIALYHEINEKWWQRFEWQEVSKKDLLTGRFKEFFKTINKNADEASVNTRYLDYLADKVFYVPKAKQFINKLSKKYDLYFITNGVEKTQTNRLNKTPFINKIKGIYISETINLKKPDKEYFDYVLNDIKINKGDALIIGDSQTSDILGGINSGIDTCLYNPNKKAVKIMPTYEIQKLFDFFKLIK